MHLENPVLLAGTAYAFAEADRPEKRTPMFSHYEAK